MMNRRKFLTQMGATSLGMTLLQSAWSKGLISDADVEPILNNKFNVNAVSGKVVVVGGGMAGTTAAKYLKLWGGNDLEVILIEPNPIYYSNIFSNMVVTGERTLSQISFNYNTIQSKYGVKVINDMVQSIDPVTKKVFLRQGHIIDYERLILAPGIDFETIPMSGTSINMGKIVHAWKAGTQTTSLRDQVNAMTKNDTFIMTIPPKPYRCPPGPYERACVVADFLKRKKGGGKVIILDANSGIQAEPINFGNAFNNTHKTVITYVPNALVSSIDADTGTVKTNLGDFKGKVINAIPQHKAGALITQSKLGLANANGGKWAGVDVLTYESTAVKDIHIIGDAASTTQPKAGHIANAEAKVCVDAVLQLMKNEPVNPSPITNSACFTPITKDTASWLSVVFRYDPVTKTMVATGNGVTESLSANQDNFDEMLKWFSNLMSDTFA